MTNHRRACTAAVAAALLVIMVAPLTAQGPYAARTGSAVAMAPVQRVDLLVGRSTILRTNRPIKRVSLPKPDIADAVVTSPTEVLVHGKTPGTISLFIWGDNGEISSYDLVVRRDLTELEQRVRQLFPGEPIEVTSNGGDVVLSGVVSSKYVVDKATSLATGYVEKAENVVNLLRQQEGLSSNQILLRVRFAEVSRSALQELGASFFTSPAGVKSVVGRVTTQQFPAPGFDKLEYTKDSGDFGAPVTSAKGEFTFSDFLNLFLLSERYDLGVMIRALSSRGLFQSLAEPNLVTQNGKEASFLAGGEYPYPVVQGTGGNMAVSITFKEFGVRLRFTPTVIGNDLINLKVAPEVSSLDFGNAVTLQGFRVPALSTRRTETEVELRDGQTFAIAGLLDNSLTQTMSKVPGIGDIPVLGYLFRSRAYQKNSTELVVIITPQILRRDSTGVTSKVPDLVEPFLGPERKTFTAPPPAFTPSRPTDVNPPGTIPREKASTSQEPAPAVAAAPSVDKDAEKRARKAAEAEAKRQAELQKKQLEQLKKLQAEQRKQDEEDQKRLAGQQKRLAEQQKKAAEQQKKAAERQKRTVEAKQEPELQQARLVAPQPAPAALPDAEEVQLRVRKLEEQRAEAERKKTEERKKAQQRDAKRRALSDPYPPLRSRRSW